MMVAEEIVKITKITIISTTDDYQTNNNILFKNMDVLKSYFPINLILKLQFFISLLFTFIEYELM